MKITLITACYNSAATIRTALESVLRQTWPEIEYCVIDGGSADGTVEILREVESEFGGRMRWLSEPDGGFYDALNKGIRMATGEVIGILNADDFFAADDVLAEVARTFADPAVDCVFGDVRFVNASDLTTTVRYYSSKYFRPWMARFGYMPAHPTFYCRRTCFEAFGTYRTDYRIAADHELLVRFLIKEKIRYRYIPKVFTVMRMGGMSTRSVESTLILNRENIRACRANGLYSNGIMQLGKYLFKIPGLLLKGGY